MSGRSRSSCDAPHQLVRIEAVGAGVDAEGQRRRHLAGTAGGRAHQVAEQGQRHVVDRDIAHVLERVQRRDAAGAGQAGDHDERPARVGGGGGDRRSGWAVGHGVKPRRSCDRDLRQGKAQLRRGRGLEGRQRQHRQGDAQQGFAAPARAGARFVRRRQIDQQSHRRTCHQLVTAKLHDAQAARLDQAGDRWPARWRSRRSLAGERGLVVGHQPGARPRSGAAPGRTCRRPRGRAARPRASSGRAAASATQVACTSVRHWRAHLPAAAGTRMVKRAPSTRPSGARRLEAVIEPP